MGWFDSISDFIGGVSNVVQTVAPVAQLGLGAYSTYQGIQAANQASDYYSQLAGTAALQDTIAQENLVRNRPVLEAEAQAALSDVQRYMDPAAVALRSSTDLNSARVANAQAAALAEAAPTAGLSVQQRATNDLAAQRVNADLVAAAGEYLPGLTEGSYQLQGAQQQNAQQQAALNSVLLGSASANLPGITNQQYALQRASLDSATANVADYEATRSLQQKFMRESEQGLDPRAAMSRAGAEVEQAVAKAGRELTRDAARRGVNMSSGQAQNMQRQNLVDAALGKSAARTKAWNDTENTNYARLGNAVNVRSGTAPATTQSSAVQSALTSGVTASLPQGFNSALLSVGGLNLPSTAATTAPRSGLTSRSSGGANAWASLADSASQSATSNLAAGGYLLGSVLNPNRV